MKSASEPLNDLHWHFVSFAEGGCRKYFRGVGITAVGIAVHDVLYIYVFQRSATVNLFKVTVHGEHE